MPGRVIHGQIYLPDGGCPGKIIDGQIYLPGWMVSETLSGLSMPDISVWIVSGTDYR